MNESFETRDWPEDPNHEGESGHDILTKLGHLSADLEAFLSCLGSSNPNRNHSPIQYNEAGEAYFVSRGYYLDEDFRVYI